MIGITNGAFIALIALGYTMVYGIVELINFAHGDLFMLGSFFALQLALWLGVTTVGASVGAASLAVVVMLVAAPLCCAALNILVDRAGYKPVRNAPKVSPVVSAIGVSLVFKK